MPTFDIIANIAMWNMWNICDVNVRDLRNANPDLYNKYKYLHIAGTYLCVGASIYSALKYY